MPINSQTTGLTKESHKLVNVSCDFHAGPTCRGTWEAQFREAQKSVTDNGGILCLQCSRVLKFSGRSNPNCRYVFNDNLFREIETEGKAYLLGWIASDGYIGTDGAIAISVAGTDHVIMRQLKELFGTDAPVKVSPNLGPDGQQWQDKHTLTVCSKEAATDLVRWLKLDQPGRKSGLIQFPDLPSRDLGFAFLRGLFDGDGSVANPGRTPYPKATIASISTNLKDQIKSFVGLPCHVNDTSIEWYGPNALDLLGKLYDGASYYLPRKRDLFLDWCLWHPSLTGKGTVGYDYLFKWNKTDPRAVSPAKERVSDTGYDVTVISELKRAGRVVFYDTGIRVSPIPNVFLMLVARSSITKTGHALANGVGILDQSYRGNVIVPLYKYDDTKPDLELPCRIAQLVPLPVCPLPIQEDFALDLTGRGDGGFGSTGG